MLPYVRNPIAAGAHKVLPYDISCASVPLNSGSGDDAAQAGNAKFAHQGHPGVPLAVVDTMYR